MRNCSLEHDSDIARSIQQQIFDKSGGLLLAIIVNEQGYSSSMLVINDELDPIVKGVLLMKLKHVFKGEVDKAEKRVHGGKPHE